MPVGSYPGRQISTGNGVTTVFPYNFRILQSSDLQVALDGVVQSSGYTVSGVGGASGGNVTFSVAPASGVQVLRQRVATFDRSDDYQRNGAFAESNVDNDYDRAIMLAQQLDDRMGRTMRAPATDSAYPSEMPSAATRANKYLGFDASGHPGAYDPASGAVAGSGNVNHLDSVAGAVSIALSAYLNLRVKGLKRTFGAVGGGVVNDYAKIASAFTTNGKIIEIEDDTFLTNTNPPAPTCAGIIGFGPMVSKLKAGVGVTKVLSITNASATYLRKLDDFAVQGNATTNARGIVLGDGGLYAGLAMRNVNVDNFTGTGAIGIYYRDIVGLVAENIRVSGCTENEVIQADVVSGCPTTLLFLGGASRTALGIGTRVRNGNSIVFEGRVFEANVNEGWKVFPQAGENAIGIVFQDCWHEGNWPGDATKYDGVVDGSLGTPFITVRGRGTIFNSGCRSLRFTGANVRSEVERIIPASMANAVVIDTGAQVNQDWPPTWDHTLYLTDTTGLLHDTKGQVWSTFTPVLTFATPGNQNIAYAADGQIGRATRDGRRVTVQINILTSTFTHTTASGNLKITGLPAAAKNITNLTQYGVLAGQGWDIGGAVANLWPVILPGTTEIIFHFGGDAISLGNAVQTEFPTGGTVALRITIAYEI